MKFFYILFIIFFSLKTFSQEVSKIDCHLHFLDFTQQTVGFPKIVEAMDSANVEKAIVFGMPIVKMWAENDVIQPEYYLDTDARAYYYSATDYILAEHLLKQKKEIQDRFFPFISGINPLDQNSVNQIEILLNIYPNFWKGIGEIMLRHDDLTGYIYGEFPRANHPAMMKIYQLAANHNLPIIIHHNISSVYNSKSIYVNELKEVLKLNPNTKFIWAHAGISRRIEVENHEEILEKLLVEYPNLHVDISWVIFDEIISENLEDWVKIIEKFPNRFVIGSDVLGNHKNYKEEIEKFDVLLKNLSEKTRRKVARENILEIINEKD
ncbi:amidohydrolase family protein [Aureivirga marina]|uniref:amidohydrolase family protein n=1 Tax=Aureivirga marina TaxID=1182451 RepID=UPI0018C9CD91|nr:amidohydrolase family protein [Aureivirga marina]